MNIQEDKKETNSKTEWHRHFNQKKKTKNEWATKLRICMGSFTLTVKLIHKNLKIRLKISNFIIIGLTIWFWLISVTPQATQMFS
jgi:hypothetical protein